MGIEKLGTKIVESVIKSASARNTISAVAKKIVPEFKPMEKFVEKFATRAEVKNYSSETLESIEKFRKTLFDTIESRYGTGKEALNLHMDYDRTIQEILLDCKNEEHAKKILSSIENIIAYRKNKADVRDFFKNMPLVDYNVKMSFLDEFARIKMFHRSAYSKLVNSKTLQEIAAGNFSPKYIENAKGADIISEDFIPKLIESMKQESVQKLVKKGVNTEFIIKYFEKNAQSIKKSPQSFEDLMQRLTSADAGLVNKILAKFGPEEYMANPNNMSALHRTLVFAEKNPDIVEKVLRMKNINPSMQMSYISMFMRGTQGQNVGFVKEEALKITDDFFNYYLDFEKANPHATNPWTLKFMNSLLNKPNVDETFVKELFEKSFKSHGSSQTFTNLAECISENNIGYVKELLKKGPIDAEMQAKILISSNPLSAKIVDGEKIEKIYQETYQPLYNIIKKEGLDESEAAYRAARIAGLKYFSPEEFKVLEDSKIIQLISEGKINSRLLEMYNIDNFKLMPEIIADVQKLAKGEGLIKKFDSVKDVITKTSSGDVISVNGKMYINNNGKLEPWNMTEEKFNELFPLVDRFSTQQANSDCYLISVLNSIYLNPRTRGSYYKMFEQKGKDIFVTIPAYAEYGGAVRFPLGRISTDIENGFSANAAKHIQMLEQSYSRVALRSGKRNIVTENPLTTYDLGFLNERIRGGQQSTVLREIQPIFRFKGKATNNISINSNNKGGVQSLLEEYANNPRYIVTEGFGHGNASVGHARSVKSYNADRQTVTLIDPYVAGLEKEISIKDFLTNLWALCISRVG